MPVEVAAEIIVRHVIRARPGPGGTTGSSDQRSCRRTPAAAGAVRPRALVHRLPAAAAETVREDLVGDALAKPGGRGERAAVYRDAPGGRFVLVQRARPAAAAIVKRMPIRRMDDEKIPDQAGRIRQRHLGAQQTVPLLHGQQPLAHAVLPEPQEYLRALQRAAARRGDGHAAPARGRALRASKARQARMMEKSVHTGSVAHPLQTCTPATGFLPLRRNFFALCPRRRGRGARLRLRQRLRRFVPARTREGARPAGKTGNG